MVISPRLKRIAESIDNCNVMADIGTDHAYLPIYLIKLGRIKKAIAADVNDGPLKIAMERINQNRLKDRIEVRKGNGLEILQAYEADVIVIAGMGGILMSDLIKKDMDIAKSAKLIILQPMRDSDIVRRCLLENGFVITDEDLVKDEGKIYEILWAVTGSSVKHNEEKLLLGRHVIDRKHPLLAELLDKRIRELENVIKSISEAGTDNSRNRMEECGKLLEYYREVRQWL